MNSYFETLIQPETKRGKKKRKFEHNFPWTGFKFRSGKYEVVAMWDLFLNRAWWNLYIREDETSSRLDFWNKSKDEFIDELQKHNFKGRNLIMRIEDNSILQIGHLVKYVKTN
jgi:hypothetical protein